MKTLLTLLTITGYSINEKELYELRKPVMEYPIEHFFNKLPEWCVRKDDGKCDLTYNYHQFTGMFAPSTLLFMPSETQKLEEHIFFNAHPCDYLLQEEISNVGFEQFFEDVDFSEIFKHIPLNDSIIKITHIPHNTHLVVELEYYEYSDGEYDLNVKIIGYLDGNMNLCRI